MRLQYAAWLTLILWLPLTAAASEPMADLIIVEKNHHTMTLYAGSEVLHRYQIAFGRSPVGKKNCEGDNKTPEGEYTINARLAHSAAHRALHISYPNATDVASAKAHGCRPGGDIMIHGLMNGYGWIGSLHRHMDWTRGCIAVTNREMDEIWQIVPTGTKVIIKP